MKLWFDVGNTRLKWQIYRDAKLIAEGSRVHSGDLSRAIRLLMIELEQITPLGEINFAGLASVLNQESLECLNDVCQSYLSCEIQKAVVTRELKGVTCAYEDVSRLGIDRWLAVVAAFHQRKKAVCVVDCGSALTIDMVNNAGKHLGGFILPGLNMSVRALLGQTHSVRFSEDKLSSVVALGRDTASAVLNGTLLQAQATIKEAVRIFEVECLDGELSQSDNLFLTGGDAQRIFEGLNLNFIRQDDLVIQGLRLVFERP